MKTFFLCIRRFLLLQVFFLLGQQVGRSQSIVMSSGSLCVGGVATFQYVGPGTVPSWTLPQGAEVYGGSPTSVTVHWIAPNSNAIISCYFVSGSIQQTVTSSPYFIGNTTSPAVSITASSTNSCAGSPVTFTAMASNAGSVPNYQWYVDGTFVTSAAGANNTFTTSNLSNGQNIYCIVGSSSSCASPSNATSNTVVVTVNPIQHLGVSISGPAAICQGQAGTFNASVSTAAGNLTYQWKRNETEVVSNTGEVTPPSVLSLNGISNGDVISCLVSTDAACYTPTATSNALTIATTAPQNFTAFIAVPKTSFCAGEQVTLTATGNLAVYDYLWFSNGIPISGASGNSYTLTVASAEQLQGISIALNTAESCVTSSTANASLQTVGFTVSPVTTPSIAISANTGIDICTGTTVALTAAATGAGNAPAYQWQLNGSNIAGATASTYSTGSLANGQQVNCVVTANAPCTTSATATSNVLTFRVTPAAATPAVPSGTTLREQGAGSSAYTSTAANATSYSWSLSPSTAGTVSQSGLVTWSDSFTGSATVFVTANGCGGASAPASLTVQVNPVLIPGQIAPASTRANYNTAPGTLTATPASGGNGVYAYQWQSSTDNSNWANISGAVGLSYVPGNITRRTFYRIAVTSGGITRYSASSTIWLMLTGGSISSSLTSVASGGGIVLNNVTPAAGGNCGDIYGYQYQSSADEYSWVNIPGPAVSGIAQTTYFRRRAACTMDTAFSNVVIVQVAVPPLSLLAPDGSSAATAGTQPVVAMPAYGTASATMANYIKTRTYTKPGITDAATANAQTGVYDVQQVTGFFDGLGRPLQTVYRQSTPRQYDLVSANFYDALGREQVQYLPYTDSAATGNFRTDPGIRQQNFYRSFFNSQENYYYQRTLYEASPLNRVARVTPPGNSWTGKNKGTTMVQRGNTYSDSIYNWTITYGTNDLPFRADLYVPGALLVEETSDESNNKTLTYKNNEGRVVLKKVQLADAQNTGYEGWLSTCYLYDGIGNLRYVLPPKLVDYLRRNNWVLNATVFNELGFRYTYDAAGKMISKSIPGGGRTDMVYDGRDRMIMTQDSLQRAQGQWLVTTYDSLNRPIQLTLWNNGNNAAYHQSQAANSVTYPAFSGTYTMLTESFYDDYTWLSRADIALSGRAFSSKFNNSTDLPVIQDNPYAVTPSVSLFTRQLATGSRIRILDPGNANAGYLYRINWYDDHNRVIQVQANNVTGGWDTVSTRYDFSGKVLSVCEAHAITGSRAPVPWNKVVMAFRYDHMGRVLQTSQYLNGVTTATVIHKNTYDELGQLKTKSLGKPLETLTYDYNIRGWLKGINRNYVLNGSDVSKWFGEDISYDYGFNMTRLDGNIAGIIWKTNGDDTAKAYGFDYDRLSRLLKADFTQQGGSGYLKGPQLDFSADSLQYDGNGNIQRMVQKGLVLNSSRVIDRLQYTYHITGEWSNRLAKVADNSGSNVPLGDFTDGANTGNDYAYDGNGNLAVDNNKGIGSIVYNYLNLPQQVSVRGKGVISYTYDALGNKLRKIILDSTRSGGPVRDSTTYTGAYVYQRDTLQYISHPEGRIRPRLANPAAGWTPANIRYVNDYFVKDHLGNIRLTLTEEGQQDAYAATMEQRSAAIENRLFDSVATTRYAVPAGFEPASGADTSNHYVARLNARSDVNKRIGPSLLLKVMAGDTLAGSVHAWYNMPAQQPAGNPGLVNVLAGLFSDGILGVAGSKFTPAQQAGIASALLPGLTALQGTQANVFNTGAPKAFLNWVLLDERFNYQSGGVVQVPAIPAGAAKQILSFSIPSVAKNGYFYTYLSNESPQDVFFDQLSVQHRRGPLLEETHYYPFGLTMAGISSRAASKLENRYKYNGIEFDSTFGLDEYEAYYRDLDPQTGRWWQIDPKLEQSMENTSPYSSMFNNPVKYSDLKGDEPESDGWLSRAWRNFKEAVAVTASQLNLPEVYDGAVNSARTFNTYVNPLTPVVEVATGKSIESDLTEDKSRMTAAGEGLLFLLPAAKAEASLLKITERTMAVTEEKSTTAVIADYSQLKDHKSVGAGKSFTSAQKKEIIEENMKRNGGVIKSDKSGIILDRAEQAKKGVPANMNQAEVDHIAPKSKGGSNSYKNAQVLSKEENIKKSNH